MLLDREWLNGVVALMGIQGRYGLTDGQLGHILELALRGEWPVPLLEVVEGIASGAIRVSVEAAEDPSDGL